MAEWSVKSSGGRVGSQLESFQSGNTNRIGSRLCNRPTEAANRPMLASKKRPLVDDDKVKILIGMGIEESVAKRVSPVFFRP